MYATTLLDGHFNATTALTGEPIIIDSFAGGGGASTGIEMALGRSPDIAINHNAAALALHGVNHPGTLHLSKNVYKFDPLDQLHGRHVGLAWFSPDCKDFSKAKGGTPVSKNIRDLAWIIPGWTERIQQSGGKVDVIIMENVEEFAQWGPVIETTRGLMPDPARRGETFQKWCRKLRSLGGKIQKRELRGCDYGAPTIRKRLFIIIRFDGQPITWPQPTHGAPDDRDVLRGRKLPWRTAAEIIDWSIPCPSIFDTNADIFAKFGLRAIRPLADNTMARLARGMHRYVMQAERPFLVQTGYGERQGQSPRALDIAKPLGTVVAGAVKHAFVSPYLAQNNYSEPGHDMRTPLSTIVGKGSTQSLVTPILTYAQQGGGSRPLDRPAHTICASAKDQNQIAAAFLAQHNGDPRENGEHAARPGRSVSEPLSTITARGTQQNVVSAFISRQYGTATGHPIDRPLATIPAGGERGGSKTNLITPHLTKMYGKSDGQPLDEPAHTTGTRTKAGIVAPFMQKYYGADQHPRIDEPLHTVTSRDRFGLAEARIAAPPFTPAMEARARQVAAFLRAHGFWDDREFVTLSIGGDTFVIVDIGMRMLTPRELYNAQGFPPDYEIERAPDGTLFSKSVQVSCVGNSVCPPVAAALVAANCNHLARERERMAA